MRRGYSVIVLATGLFSVVLGARLHATQTATWDGTASNQWHEANWTFNGNPAKTADLVTAEGHVGGRGGIDWVIGNGAQVVHNQNRDCSDPTKPCDLLGQGDFKPRMDLTPGGSITIKEGAALNMDSHTDTDGRWSRISVSMTLDNGTWRRTHSGTSQSGGKIIFGYHGELLANQKININLLNGGRIENSGKMVFGDLDYFTSQGGSNNGHQDGIEVAMTINNGSLDLTGGDYLDYPFGALRGELLFDYEYHEGVGPRNEKYSVNFTGPGSITVDPYLIDDGGTPGDVSDDSYGGGIYVAKQDSGGTWAPLVGPSFYVPIGYQDLWNLGILQANGQSGLTGANFNTYFSVTGDQYHLDYKLTSLLPAVVAGDYNGDGKVNAADYVLWRNDPASFGGNPAGYNTWRANFGTGGPGSGSGLGAAAVPEPTSLWLVFGAMCVVGAKLRVKRLQ